MPSFHPSRSLFGRPFWLLNGSIKCQVWRDRGSFGSSSYYAFSSLSSHYLCDWDRWFFRSWNGADVTGICLTSWTKYAYLVRSLLLDIKEEPYFRYADMFGNTFWSKIKLYYLPSVFPQVVTTMVYDLNTIVMEIAGMSFIGLGAQMPDAEWGAMINTGRSYLQTAPWIVAFPSLFLILFIGGVMVLGKLLKQYFAIQQAYK